MMKKNPLKNTEPMKAKVTVEGYKGEWKVFVEDRYGKTLYSGRKWKTKLPALKEAKGARKWVKY